MQRLSLIILSCLLIFGAASMAGAQEYTNRVVAVVNGEIITMFELNQRMGPFLEQFRGRNLGEAEKKAIQEARKQVLDQMIDDILLEQEVEALEIEVSQAEIENRIRDLRQRLDRNGQSLEDFMKLKGYDREKLEAEVKNEILKHKLIGFWVRRKVVVTQEEIKEFYEEHKTDYVQEKRVAVRLILPPPTTSVEELRTRIQNGELSFAEAADIYSQGPGAGEGGYIGMLRWRDLAPEWKEALDGLKAGDLSEPFMTQGHEALLKVEEVQSGDLQPLEEVQDKIKDAIYEKKYSNRLDEYLSGLRKKAVIDIKI